MIIDKKSLKLQLYLRSYKAIINFFDTILRLSQNLLWYYKSIDFPVVRKFYKTQTLILNSLT